MIKLKCILCEKEVKGGNKMIWSIKQMMQPVITRLFIYGMNAIDLERVFKQLEETPLLRAQALETAWIKEWEKKAKQFRNMAEEAEEKGYWESAKTFRRYVTQCDYASFLINGEDINLKRAIYETFEADYKIYTKYLTGDVQNILIPYDKNKYLKGYLHLPLEKKEKWPCMILFAGEGSSKEELNTLARAFVKRGMAVLAWDSPGTGSTLFEAGIKTSFENLKQSFEKVFEFVKTLPYIDENNIGVCGLCMGGGYAHYAAAHTLSVKCCINLFPLFVSQTDLNNIPRWMKVGKWADYQRTLSVNQFLEDMKQLEDGAVACDYLIAVGKYDNWMPCDVSKKLYEKATGNKEIIQIDEVPAFGDAETMLHTMPVGEQMHWLKHVIADWAMTKMV